jgi:tRNA-Thr(GGU) m(6)t(6)A37 methyltransferase TsaA
MKRPPHFRTNRRRFGSLLALGGWRPDTMQPGQDTQTMFEQLKIDPIGVIETPFREPAGTPIQPSRANGARGKVRIESRFQAGLKDLAGFERIWLIYWFHKASGSSLLATPFLDTRERGIFATRAPARPSPVGISAVRLLAVQEGGVLEVADVDIIDGTPLLDIKPYVPEFDCYANSRAGWFDESNSRRRVADERFEAGSNPKGPAKR